MTTITRPPSGVLRRLMTTSPSSYDAKARTVETVISTGVPVNRYYGTEELEISRAACDLTRINSVGVPCLDSHQIVGISNSIGKITAAWIEDGALIGEIRFHATPEGRAAEGMVSRMEVGGVSAGYTVSCWRVTDDDGDEIDPETDRMDYESNYTFTAVRWMLHEVSLVSVPADATAQIRSMGKLSTPRSRMWARQRMYERMSRCDD